MSVSTRKQLPDVRISNLVFNTGEEISIGPTDVIVFVGANNSGKSQALKDVEYLFSNQSKGADQRGRDTVVVESISFESAATPGLVDEYYKSLYEFKDGYYRLPNGSGVYPHQLQQVSNGILDFIAPEYIKRIDSSTRLSAANPTQAPKAGVSPKSPMQDIYADESKLQSLSNIFEQAFGMKVLNNYRAGGEVYLHTVSQKFEGKGDRVSDEYINWLQSQTPLAKQGDGMRSYAGIIIDAVVSPKQIVLVDEPEAFLHPPQKRKLGKALSEHSIGQTFIATHSSEILQGLAESPSSKVRVIRLIRKGNETHVFEAGPTDVSALFNEPILRYSKAMDAIFHESAYICEDDSDCRLYQAVYEHCSEKSEMKFPDAHFIPSGGKNNIFKIFQALKKVGADVNIICDIDLLNSWEVLSRLITIADGDPQRLKPLWNDVESSVTSGKSANSIPEIKAAIIDKLNASEPDRLPKSDINELMKSSSPWWKLKAYGVSVLKGQAMSSFNELYGALVSLGIYVVKEGELESLVPEIAGHGPRFVNNVLTKYSLDSDHLEDLREFVTELTA